MKRSHFYLGTGFAFAAFGMAAAFGWYDHGYLLPFACLANFSFGRWAEITK